MHRIRARGVRPLIIAAAALVMLVFAACSGGGESKSPTPTFAPTPSPTAPGSPTPTNDPSMAYWTRNQIKAAQQAALSQGNIVLADTWSKDGAILSAGTAAGNNVLFLTGFQDGAEFRAPVGGSVFSIELGQGEGFFIRTLYVFVGDKEYSFAMNADNTMLVEEKQPFSVGTPLFKIAGLIPDKAGGSAPSQVTMFNVTKQNSTIEDDLLRDDTGKIVALGE